MYEWLKLRRQGTRLSMMTKEPQMNKFFGFGKLVIVVLFLAGGVWAGLKDLPGRVRILEDDVIKIKADYNHIKEEIKDSKDMLKGLRK